MKDRELIARNIINIIDVKNNQYFNTFMNDDMYDRVYDYMLKVSRGNKEAAEQAKIIMGNNKPVFDKIVQGANIPIVEFNSLMECFRVFKKKYLM